MSETKVLTLKNHTLLPLAKFLGESKLNGKDSRYRTRFLKVLVERIEETEKERLELCKKYSEKQMVNGVETSVLVDKDGKDTFDEKVSVAFKLGNLDEFNKEYLSLLNETLVIDVTPANKDMIYTVKDVLLNTTVEFKDGDAATYNTWCDAFESMK